MNITLQDILRRIAQADEQEINEIMSAVQKRFKTAFPDWEVLYISCPKNDPIQRRETMAYILTHFQNT